MPANVFSCTSLRPFGKVALDPGLPFLVSSFSGEYGVGVGECSEDDAPDRDGVRLLAGGMMILGDVESPHAHCLSDHLLTVVHTLVCTAPVEIDPFRFSLQNEHCVAGLPFFLTSNNGRSV